jgi:hypothetical protein
MSMYILFRIGPILMLIPVLLWTTIWGLVSYHHDPGILSVLIILPFFLFLLIAAFWHVALILFEEGRRLAYLAYAILFMPALFVISLLAGMAATNTWSTV